MNQIDIDIVFEALYQSGLLPQKDILINILLFTIIVIGFIIIVMGSKKYSYLMDSIEKYF